MYVVKKLLIYGFGEKNDDTPLVFFLCCVTYWQCYYMDAGSKKNMSNEKKKGRGEGCKTKKSPM